MKILSVRNVWLSNLLTRNLSVKILSVRNVPVSGIVMRVTEKMLPTLDYASVGAGLTPARGKTRFTGTGGRE